MHQKAAEAAEAETTIAASAVVFFQLFQRHRCWRSQNVAESCVDVRRRSYFARDFLNLSLECGNDPLDPVVQAKFSDARGKFVLAFCHLRRRVGTVCRVVQVPPLADRHTLSVARSQSHSILATLLFRRFEREAKATRLADERTHSWLQIPEKIVSRRLTTWWAGSEVRHSFEVACFTLFGFIFLHSFEALVISLFFAKVIFDEFVLFVVVPAVSPTRTLDGRFTAGWAVAHFNVTLDVACVAGRRLEETLVGERSVAFGINFGNASGTKSSLKRRRGGCFRGISAKVVPAVHGLFLRTTFERIGAVRGVVEYCDAS